MRANLLLHMALALTTGTAACASVIGLDELHRNGPAGGVDAGGTSTPSGEDPGADSPSTPKPGQDASTPSPPPAKGGGTAVDASPPGDPTCGAKAGPAMLRVSLQGQSFCIDTTEVTNDDYAAFLSSNNPSSFVPQSCDWHTADVHPSQGWPAAPNAGRQPVRWVDWCDAAAYCAWAGKALCGGGQGSGFDPTGLVGNVTGRWSIACNGAASAGYPYGSAYAGGTCVDNGSTSAGPLDVASKASCVGGVPGLFDMSGNVAEWEDSCNTSSGGGGRYGGGGGRGGDTTCDVRGGAYDTESSSTLLSCAGRVAQPRDTTAPDIGFRCCSQ